MKGKRGTEYISEYTEEEHQGGFIWNICYSVSSLLHQHDHNMTIAVCVTNNEYFKVEFIHFFQTPEHSDTSAHRWK